MTRLTVLTYNIAGAKHRQAVGSVVTALAPDVLVVNESPRLPVLWRLQCDQLARECGLGRAAGGRDAGRNLICVSDRVKVVATTATRLPQPLFAPRRGIVTAQCRVDGANLGVVGVHLSLTAEARMLEAQAAIAAANKLAGPVVVCGDLNEPPGGRVWRVFESAGFVDFGKPRDYTFSAGSPTKRIDAVLVRGGSVVSYGVPERPAVAYSSASDHRPVRAVIELAT